MKASALRRKMSLPEVLLWQELRRCPKGLRFRRQHPAGRYILDFYCATRRLAVEIDGSSHNGQAQWQHDQPRDAWLAGQGVLVLRIAAAHVLADVTGTAGSIVTMAMARPDISA